MRHGAVVIGASLAGLRAVETLRMDGYDGTITLVGAEDRLPYDRPPLSKKVLSGEWDPERVALRKDGELDRLEVDLRLGVRAERLDLTERKVSLSDGSAVAFDGLVIATGAAVRRLPGQPDLDGVHVLRTLDDCLALRAVLVTGTPRVVVIGAGFIGAEVAATARGLGCQVTIVEALPVPLVRALGPEMGMRLRGAPQGPRRRRSTWASGWRPSRVRERVERVRLTDGTVRGGRRRGGRGRGRAGHGLAGGLRPRAARRRGVRRHPRAPARPGSTRPVTSAGGRTTCSPRRCGSSTGPMPPSRAPMRLAACSPPRAGDARRALRVRAVLLERPVRHTPAVPRAGRAGRRGPGGQRVGGGAGVRRPVRPRRAASEGCSVSPGPSW